jgi:hypothetical protein
MYSTYTTPGDPVTKVNFSLTGSSASAIKKKGFPALVYPGSHTFEVGSSTNPIIIEIWRHSEENFYMNYLGEFN